MALVYLPIAISLYFAFFLRSTFALGLCLLGVLDLNSVLSDWVADGWITYLIMGNPCVFWLIDVPHLWLY
jgi:uncharacterized membrane protein HdeD (DUF308 family)